LISMRYFVPAILILLASAVAAHAVAAERPTAVPIDADVRRTLQTHCLACHAGDDAESGFDLERLVSRDANLASLGDWQHVLAMVSAGDMPPQGERPPSLEEREQLVAWIEKVSADLVDPNDPGPAVLRRLTRRGVARGTV